MATYLTQGQRARAASAYRALLRAQRQTFADDSQTRQIALSQSRILFRTKVLNPAPTPAASSSSSTTTIEIGGTVGDENAKGKGKAKDQVDAIDAVFELARFLRSNLVQGRKVEGQDRFSLRITPETELGDNESVKKAMKDAGKFSSSGPATTGGCCGGSSASASIPDSTTTSGTVRVGGFSQRDLEQMKRANEGVKRRRKGGDGIAHGGGGGGGELKEEGKTQRHVS